MSKIRNEVKQKNVGIIKARLGGLALLLIWQLFILCAVTQVTAAKLGYQKALGEPVLFNIFYAPWDFFIWLFKFYEQADRLFLFGAVAYAFAALIGIVAYKFGTGFISRSTRKIEDVHGSARFADMDSVKSASLIGNNGVYCGTFHNPKTGKNHYLRHDGPEHVLAFAPTRSGKGVGLVVPTLLSWSHSAFVFDIKGENYAMTAGFRRSIGQKIFRFDPAEIDQSCGWNALEEINFGTRHQVSEAQAIALMVVDDDGKGLAGDHFRTAAFEFLSGLILFALYRGQEIGRTPGLPDCAQMISAVGEFAIPVLETDDEEEKPNSQQALFTAMRDFKGKCNGVNGSEQADQEAALLINAVGNRMITTTDRELSGVVNTANNALSLYRDPIIGANTTRSDFRINDLMNHDTPISVYFVVTPKTRAVLRPLIRLFLTQIVTQLADRMEFDNGRSKTVHKHRLLLMLDEFPTLGKLEQLEEALAFIAGYGIKAYLIVQDTSQLHKAYTNYESIVSNCHVRIAYAPNKPETAEWMSKMTGTTTVIKESVSNSGGRFDLMLGQVNRSYQEVSRPLMTADEITRMPGPVKDEKDKIIAPGEMLIFVAGSDPIKGIQILYFLDPVFTKRSQIPPPSELVSIEHAGLIASDNSEPFVFKEETT